MRPIGRDGNLPRSRAETVLQNLMEADVEGTLRCRSPGSC
jgi:hypothetical protein